MGVVETVFVRTLPSKQGGDSQHVQTHAPTIGVIVVPLLALAADYVVACSHENNRQTSAFQVLQLH